MAATGSVIAGPVSASAADPVDGTPVLPAGAPGTGEPLADGTAPAVRPGAVLLGGVGEVGAELTTRIANGSTVTALQPTVTSWPGGVTVAPFLAVTVSVWLPGSTSANAKPRPPLRHLRGVT